MQERAGVAERSEKMGRQMIQSALPPSFRTFVEQLQTWVVSAADGLGRPWVTLLTGPAGFVGATDGTRVDVRTPPPESDPVFAGLQAGSQVGMLGMHFPTRSRIRVNGTVARAASDGFEVSVKQAYGNCQAYIQARSVSLRGSGHRPPAPRTHRRPSLAPRDADLVASADTFFIGTQAIDVEERVRGMDVSHRGGPPGFVSMTHESLLLFPDYRGNGMFNTLGNLQVDPRAGLLFIDFDSGDTLQLTGRAQVLWDTHHIERFPGAQRVVAFSVEQVVRTERALQVDWTFQRASPAFRRFASKPGGEGS